MRPKTLAAFHLALSAAVLAHAGITNPSFESPALSPGGFLNGSIPGWSGPTDQNYFFGITAEITPLPPIPDGLQVAFVNNFGTASGTPTSHAIAQQLSEVLEPNVAYLVSASFGWRNDNAESVGRIEIWCGGAVSGGEVIGGTMLASKVVTLAKGKFVRDMAVFYSLPPWDHLGEPLSVRLVGTPVANGFAQTNFDAVQLLQERLTPCPADFNGDNVVDDLDFSTFVVQYDALECDPTPLACTADLNLDGLVDDADFTRFVVAYNELLCMDFVPRMRPVSQSRVLALNVGHLLQYKSADDFNPFSGQLELAGGGVVASAFQNSSMSASMISVGQVTEVTGPGANADAAFEYVFDLDYQAPYTLITDVQSTPQVNGLFSGPHISLDLTFPGPFSGTLLPGRYTMTHHCRSEGGSSTAKASALFKLNELP